MKNISAALEYMHSEGYIHRDLTSSNLLVTDGYEAKVNTECTMLNSVCKLSLPAITEAQRTVYLGELFRCQV